MEKKLLAGVGALTALLLGGAAQAHQAADVQTRATQGSWSFVALDQLPAPAGEAATADKAPVVLASNSSSNTSSNTSSNSSSNSSSNTSSNTSSNGSSNSSSNTSSNSSSNRSR